MGGKELNKTIFGDRRCNQGSKPILDGKVSEKGNIPKIMRSTKRDPQNLSTQVIAINNPGKIPESKLVDHRKAMLEAIWNRYGEGCLRLWSSLILAYQKETSKYN